MIDQIGFTWPMIFMLLLLFAAFLCLFRIAKGPSAPDRTVAIDILGTLMVGFCAVLSWISGKDFYMNIGITWALLSFIGTIALAKYLEGRSYDD
ncbi:cation:proton antiporter [Candidatus Latescibacterota bacterium]